jgi:hypothetical protein
VPVLNPHPPVSFQSSLIEPVVQIFRISALGPNSRLSPMGPALGAKSAAAVRHALDIGVYAELARPAPTSHVSLLPAQRMNSHRYGTSHIPASVDACMVRLHSVPAGVASLRS